MNEVRPHAVRGWCPGALRPMQSGDGLIVRLRPRAGAFNLGDMLAIARMAKRHGNGLIDLTRRANLQMRGVRADALPALWSELRAAGLLDDNAEAEAVRNVMASPLSGVDPEETADTRGIAREIEHCLADDENLWRLPAKFCFIVDGGGAMTLDAERADIRLKATRIGDEIAVAIGLDGMGWIGATNVQAAATLAVRATRAFLAVAPDTRARMRDLTDGAREQVRSTLATHLERFDVPPGSAVPQRCLGRVGSGSATIAVGFAAPFGRIEADVLGALAAAAQKLGAGEMRLSPWRALYVPLANERAVADLLSVATASGLIIDASDPLLAVDACPGAAGCRSTALDTRASARQLAPALAKLGCRSAHVSGCAKGCARTKPADLVLVGSGNCYGILRHDTAQGQPHLFVAPARLSELPGILEAS